jgi:hypothetical protein
MRSHHSTAAKRVLVSPPAIPRSRDETHVPCIPAGRRMSLRIPARHANLAFSFLMSLQMAAIMSGIITAVNRGLGAGYFAAWAHSFVVAWPIAFPLILLLAPRARALVARLTAAD